MKTIRTWAMAAVAGVMAMPLGTMAQEGAPALGGPAVSGVCLLSREAVLANTQAGKSASEKLQQLTRDAQAEISREQSQLDPELERLGLRKPGLQESQLNEQQRAGLQKLQVLQEKAAERGREIEEARLKAMQRISEEAQPVIAEVYAKHKCGLLLNRNSVLGGNLSNDLTAEVVKALDAKISALPITIETAAK
ncbi:OmpH family outer membrane protein [Pseudothauera rhizosphaerae]|uniref:OmpH family outer membrane protein n=1 Tax=Pseudothauera rhizosphaerae TaxID=2565932 RepID=A0A4S4AIK2_9RHOO|nr:OmpH family outer membrane protein [Pseudothauera rhizosphaerae]THF58676.1 OmpH family outer membrane protein [Pseudothauera rhizosphaerae]